MKSATNNPTGEETNNGATTVSASKNSDSSSCNNIDPCVGIEAANKKYRARCKAAELQETCLDFCRYDATKKEVICGIFQIRFVTTVHFFVVASRRFPPRQM